MSSVVGTRSVVVVDVPPDEAARLDIPERVIGRYSGLTSDKKRHKISLIGHKLPYNLGKKPFTVQIGGITLEDNVTPLRVAYRQNELLRDAAKPDWYYRFVYYDIDSPQTHVYVHLIRVGSPLDNDLLNKPYRVDIDRLHRVVWNGSLAIRPLRAGEEDDDDEDGDFEMTDEEEEEEPTTPPSPEQKKPKRRIVPDLLVIDKDKPKKKTVEFEDFDFDISHIALEEGDTEQEEDDDEDEEKCPIAPVSTDPVYYWDSPFQRDLMYFDPLPQDALEELVTNRIGRDVGAIWSFSTLDPSTFLYEEKEMPTPSNKPLKIRDEQSLVVKPVDLALEIEGVDGLSRKIAILIGRKRSSLVEMATRTDDKTALSSGGDKADDSVVFFTFVFPQDEFVVERGSTDINEGIDIAAIWMRKWLMDEQTDASNVVQTVTPAFWMNAWKDLQFKVELFPKKTGGKLKQVIYPEHDLKIMQRYLTFWTSDPGLIRATTQNDEEIILFTQTTIQREAYFHLNELARLYLPRSGNQKLGVPENNSWLLRPSDFTIERERSEGIIEDDDDDIVMMGDDEDEKKSKKKKRKTTDTFVITHEGSRSVFSYDDYWGGGTKEGPTPEFVHLVSAAVLFTAFYRTFCKRAIPSFYVISEGSKNIHRRLKPLIEPDANVWLLISDYGLIVLEATGVYVGHNVERRKRNTDAVPTVSTQQYPVVRVNEYLSIDDIEEPLLASLEKMQRESNDKLSLFDVVKFIHTHCTTGEELPAWSFVLSNSVRKSIPREGVTTTLNTTIARMFSIEDIISQSYQGQGGDEEDDGDDEDDGMTSATDTDDEEKLRKDLLRLPLQELKSRFERNLQDHQADVVNLKTLDTQYSTVFQQLTTYDKRLAVVKKELAELESEKAAAERDGDEELVREIEDEIERVNVRKRQPIDKNRTPALEKAQALIESIRAIKQREQENLIFRARYAASLGGPHTAYGLMDRDLYTYTFYELFKDAGMAISWMNRVIGTLCTSPKEFFTRLASSVPREKGRTLSKAVSLPEWVFDDTGLSVGEHQIPLDQSIVLVSWSAIAILSTRMQNTLSGLVSNRFDNPLRPDTMTEEDLVLETLMLDTQRTIVSIELGAQKKKKSVALVEEGGDGEDDDEEDDDDEDEEIDSITRVCRRSDTAAAIPRNLNITSRRVPSTNTYDDMPRQASAHRDMLGLLMERRSMWQGDELKDVADTPKIGLEHERYGQTVIEVLRDGLMEVDRVGTIAESISESIKLKVLTFEKGKQNLPQAIDELLARLNEAVLRIYRLRKQMMEDSPDTRRLSEEDREAYVRYATAFLEYRVPSQFKEATNEEELRALLNKFTVLKQRRLNIWRRLLLYMMLVYMIYERFRHNIARLAITVSVASVVTLDDAAEYTSGADLKKLIVERSMEKLLKPVAVHEVDGETEEMKKKPQSDQLVVVLPGLEMTNVDLIAVVCKYRESLRAYNESVGEAERLNTLRAVQRASTVGRSSGIAVMGGARESEKPAELVRNALQTMQEYDRGGFSRAPFSGVSAFAQTSPLVFNRVVSAASSPVSDVDEAEQLFRELEMQDMEVEQEEAVEREREPISIEDQMRESEVRFTSRGILNVTTDPLPEPEPEPESEPEPEPEPERKEPDDSPSPVREQDPSEYCNSIRDMYGENIERRSDPEPAKRGDDKLWFFTDVELRRKQYCGIGGDETWRTLTLQGPKERHAIHGVRVVDTKIYKEQLVSDLCTTLGTYLHISDGGLDLNSASADIQEAFLVPIVNELFELYEALYVKTLKGVEDEEVIEEVHDQHQLREKAYSAVLGYIARRNHRVYAKSDNYRLLVQGVGADRGSRDEYYDKPLPDFFFVELGDHLKAGHLVLGQKFLFIQKHNDGWKLRSAAGYVVQLTREQVREIDEHSHIVIVPDSHDGRPNRMRGNLPFGYPDLDLPNIDATQESFYSPPHAWQSMDLYGSDIDDEEEEEQPTSTTATSPHEDEEEGSPTPPYEFENEEESAAVEEAARTPSVREERKRLSSVDEQRDSVAQQIATLLMPNCDRERVEFAALLSEWKTLNTPASLNTTSFNLFINNRYRDGKSIEQLVHNMAELALCINLRPGDTLEALKKRLKTRSKVRDDLLNEVYKLIYDTRLWTDMDRVDVKAISAKRLRLLKSLTQKQIDQLGGEEKISEEQTEHIESQRVAEEQEADALGDDVDDRIEAKRQLRTPIKSGPSPIVDRPPVSPSRDDDDDELSQGTPASSTYIKTPNFDTPASRTYSYMDSQEFDLFSSPASPVGTPKTPKTPSIFGEDDDDESETEEIKTSPIRELSQDEEVVYESQLAEKRGKVLTNIALLRPHFRLLRGARRHGLSLGGQERPIVAWRDQNTGETLADLNVIQELQEIWANELDYRKKVFGRLSRLISGAQRKRNYVYDSVDILLNHDGDDARLFESAYDFYDLTFGRNTSSREFLLSDVRYRTVYVTVEKVSAGKVEVNQYVFNSEESGGVEKPYETTKRRALYTRHYVDEDKVKQDGTLYSAQELETIFENTPAVFYCLADQLVSEERELDIIAELESGNFVENYSDESQGKRVDNSLFAVHERVGTTRLSPYERLVFYRERPSMVSSPWTPHDAISFAINAFCDRDSIVCNPHTVHKVYTLLQMSNERNRYPCRPCLADTTLILLRMLGETHASPIKFDDGAFGSNHENLFKPDAWEDVVRGKPGRYIVLFMAVTGNKHESLPLVTAVTLLSVGRGQWLAFDKISNPRQIQVHTTEDMAKIVVSRMRTVQRIVADKVENFEMSVIYAPDTPYALLTQTIAPHFVLPLEGTYIRSSAALFVIVPMLRHFREDTHGDKRVAVQYAERPLSVWAYIIIKMMQHIGIRGSIELLPLPLSTQTDLGLSTFDKVFNDYQRLVIFIEERDDAGSSQGPLSGFMELAALSDEGTQTWSHQTIEKSGRLTAVTRRVSKKSYRARLIDLVSTSSRTRTPSGFILVQKVLARP